jgi:hypothetical protein
MKKMIIQNSKYVIVGLILITGINSVFAEPQVKNTSTPPENNTDVPINVGTTAQEKGQGAVCTGTGTSCGLSVNEFVAASGVQFNAQLVLEGSVLGNAQKEVLIGSTNVHGVTATGGFSTETYFQSDTLKHSSSQPQPLCNDSAGNIVKC